MELTVSLLKKLLFLIFTTCLNAQGNMELQVDYELKEADVIGQGLREFNSSFFGHEKCINFAIYLKDENHQVVGGVIAWMRPGIKLLFIDTIWISETLRKQGYGTQLVLAAEAEGKRQGCTHAQVETLPFQAEQFYQKLGYYRIGVVEKFYGEHDAIYMLKNLDLIIP